MPGTGNPLGNSELDLPFPPALRAACWQKVWSSRQLLHPFRGDPDPGGDCSPGKFQQNFQTPEMGTERSKAGTSLMNSVEQIKALEPVQGPKGGEASPPHPTTGQPSLVQPGLERSSTACGTPAAWRPLAPLLSSPPGQGHTGVSLYPTKDRTPQPLTTPTGFSFAYGQLADFPSAHQPLTVGLSTPEVHWWTLPRDGKTLVSTLPGFWSLLECLFPGTSRTRGLPLWQPESPC